jgi:sugar phosphate permease
MLWIAAISACLGAIVLWQLAMIAALRLFATKLPFSVAFHIHPRRQHELLAALKGRGKDTFIFIYGFLLLACPLFVGLTAYDYTLNRAAGRPAYGLNDIVGSVVAFVVMIAAGVWTSTSSWNKYYSDSSPHS